MKVEFIEGEIAKNRAKIVDTSEVSLSPTNQERYVSLFGFDDQIVDYVKYQNTVSGFKGSYFLNQLYFDVDCDVEGQPLEENLEMSRQYAIEFIKGLQSSLNISPLSIDIYFSGGKGFHLGLHEKMFGGFRSSPYLPTQVKNLAKRITAKAYGLELEDLDKELDGAKKKNFRGIDLSIYNNNRIFRTALSRHPKTGFYKIRITAEELFEKSASEIVEIAEEPRDIPREREISRIYKMQALEDIWAAACKFDTSKDSKGFGDDYKDEKKYYKIFEAPEGKGERNNRLFTMACHLYDHSEMSSQDISDLIYLVNRSLDIPLPSHEVRNILKSSERKTAPNRMERAKVEQKEIMDFSGLLEQWESYHLSNKKKMTSGFEAIDKDIRSQYIGTLGLVAGSAGTLKSYFTLNFLVKNILYKDSKILLSSMEMGAVQLSERILDMIITPSQELIDSIMEAEEEMPVSEILTMGLKQDAKSMREIVREGTQFINSKLGVSLGSFKTVEDYKKMLDDFIRMRGSVDALVIDGLANMGGSDEEIKRMSDNTTQLKELAKDYDISILAIAHTTKECNEFERDPRQYVRGSQKIMDNVDYSIGMSKLIDENSDVDDIREVPSLGHVKFWNKRGSGRTINHIYKFNPKTKTMSESHMAPEMFPTLRKFQREKAKWGQTKEKGGFGV